MVMPRALSSGAASIWSYALYSPKYFVIAAVRDVLPWSTWPIVPMLTCGLLRSNLLFAIFGSPFLARRALILVIGQLVFRSLLTGILCLDFGCDVRRDRRVMIEGHRVLSTAPRHGAQVIDVLEHVRQRNVGVDDNSDTTAFLALDLTTTGVQVADDIADIIFRGDDFDLHHRLE